MRLAFPGRRPLGVLAVLSLALAPALWAADDKINSEEVRFESADKVLLKGTFYPSNQGNKAPAVIFLHKVGESREKEGWKSLAVALQKKGYAVLSFDFRGHNDSTTLADESVFWNLPINARTFRPGKDARDKINQADIAKYNKNYYPMLVQDVFAAKRYLDQRNDANDCNSSNTIVIGAEDGAGLGALWMAAEWVRQKPTNPLLGGVPKYEGEDIAGAVWLSIPERFAGYPVKSWLAFDRVRDKVPMAFFYGDGDTYGKAAANSIYKSMKVPGAKLDATRLREKKNTKSSGVDLLGKKGLGTEEDVVSYLDTVMERRGTTVWVKKDVHMLPFFPINLRQLNVPIP